jgi:hypothetical protein
LTLRVNFIATLLLGWDRDILAAARRLGKVPRDIALDPDFWHG